MFRNPTITLGVCAVAALAAGFALTRPGPDPVSSPAAAVTAEAGSGYGSGSDAGSDSGSGEASTAEQDQAPAEQDQAPAEQGGPSTITIADFAFGEPLTVAPGAAINVTNEDTAPHTVTATEGGFDTGSIAGGGTGTFTAPTEPGTYTFFCTIHPSMQGSLTVSG